MITKLEFKSLQTQGFNRIPLVVEAFADLETPLSLHLLLAHSKNQGKHSFLLESVVVGERFGRYSFIGLPARSALHYVATYDLLPSIASLSFQSAGCLPSQILSKALKNSGSLNGSP